MCVCVCDSLIKQSLEILETFGDFQSLVIAMDNLIRWPFARVAVELSAGLIPRSGIARRTRWCVFVIFTDFARLEPTKKLYYFFPSANNILIFLVFNKHLLSSYQGPDKCRSLRMKAETTTCPDSPNRCAVLDRAMMCFTHCQSSHRQHQLVQTQISKIRPLALPLIL